jgi:proline iminopeptidase
MTELSPPIEPYDHGLLDVGDGNLVYWETCENPVGKPAVMVHGSFQELLTVTAADG